MAILMGDPFALRAVMVMIDDDAGVLVVDAPRRLSSRVMHEASSSGHVPPRFF
jgi:hypothetical protein